MSDSGLLISDPEATEFNQDMLTEWGFLYRLLGFGRALSKIQITDEDAQRVQELHKEGAVVFAMTDRSQIEHLALNTVLLRQQLPLSQFAYGLQTTRWRPLKQWLSRIKIAWSSDGIDPASSGWFGRLLGEGGVATVFVNSRTSTFTRWFRRRPNAFELIVNAATLTDTKIFVVPTAVIWQRSPSSENKVRDFFFAPQRRGSIRRWWDVYWRAPEAVLRVGEPIEVHQLLRVSKERRATALVKLVTLHQRAEAKTVHGPSLLPNRVLKRLVLDQHPMHELARAESEATGRSVEVIERQMAKHYDRIAARFSWIVIRFLHIVARPLWTRVFSGVDIREEDLRRLKDAIRDGSAVLIPCHKSHFDYVLLTWVCFEHGITIPHVIAGMNLAIWPISVILRGAGGFFIQRSFAGERLFPAVFSRYLRELILHEYPIEFFIEGGRTRSGKLLPPRVGVLGMVLEAAAVRHSGREVTLLPIALSYEQVAEEGVYARELGGEEKAPETVGQLFQARSVLSRRFGRAYLRIGTPIKTSEYTDATETKPQWCERTRQDNKRTLHQLGELIIHRIGEAVVLLPTSLVALALLGHHRRAIYHEELLARCERLLKWMRALNVHESTSLNRTEEAISQALDRFVQAGRIEPLSQKQQRVWAIRPKERITLEFYKNQVVHHFALAALATASIRRLPREQAFTADQLEHSFYQLMCLFRKEFIWDPTKDAQVHLKVSLAQLVAHGALKMQGNKYIEAEPAFIGEIYALALPFLEAYALVLCPKNNLSGHREQWIKSLQKQQQTWIENKQLTRPEALSMLTLKNAIDTYVDDGLIKKNESGILTLQSDAAPLRKTLQTMLS